MYVMEILCLSFSTPFSTTNTTKRSWRPQMDNGREHQGAVREHTIEPGEWQRVVGHDQDAVRRCCRRLNNNKSRPCQRNAKNQSQSTARAPYWNILVGRERPTIRLSIVVQRSDIPILGIGRDSYNVPPHLATTTASRAWVG